MQVARNNLKSTFLGIFEVIIFLFFKLSHFFIFYSVGNNQNNSQGMGKWKRKRYDKVYQKSLMCLSELDPPGADIWKSREPITSILSREVD